MKKVIKRFFQEVFGKNTNDVAFPAEFDGQNWSVVLERYKGTKPSQRLKYYKDFRFFVKEIKIEMSYEKDYE